MALVLCTGVDDPLLRTRKLVLEFAGNTVLIARSSPEVRAACQRYAFDVVVIGEAIPGPEKLRIFSLVREQRPDALVLELYRQFGDKILHGADDWLAVPADLPPELAERVASLAARRLK